MKADINILSISDVITNSSSEVFIIHGKPECQDELIEEIPELLDKLCEAVGLDINEIMDFEISDSTYDNEDWNYHVENNDLIIQSQSDNSIPSWLMDFIESLYYLPKFKDKFYGYYAKDLGEKKLRAYNWNTGEYEIVNRRIESIHREHLG